MSLYVPIIILGLIYGLYEVTRRLNPRTKGRILWRLVTAVLVIGAVGAAYQLLTKGYISAPPSLEGPSHPAAM